MKIFLIGLVIGIGKVIPGVSGAIIAVNLGVYEKLINSICNLNKKDNLKFVLIIGLGILISIILGSRIILYLINDYYFITMMFFIGLLLNGLINFSKSIKHNYLLLIIITLISSSILFINFNISFSFNNNISLFIGGIIEIISSIIPGISGTSLNMILGIYNKVLLMISNIYNINYVINNINLYLSYGLGMFISLIFMLLIINNLINNNKNLFNIFILGFSISSLLFLITKTFNYTFNFINLIIGIILFIIGYIISSILNKYISN